MFGSKGYVEIQISSDIGNCRPVQQDNFFCMKKILRHDEIEHYDAVFCNKIPAIYAVCDGMGGESEGEVASYIAASSIEKVSIRKLKKKSDEDLVLFLRENLQKINNFVYKSRSTQDTVCGTTIALYYIDKRRICVANVGDSAVFLVRNGSISMMSELDNQAHRLYRMGILTEEQRWKDKRKRCLTQFLGMDDKKMLLSPHISVFHHKEAESIIGILCTDGVLDGLRQDDLMKIIASSKSTENCARRMIEVAKENGSKDNLTVLIIKFEKRR